MTGQPPGNATTVSQPQDGLPEPGEQDYPLHLLAQIPGITPWALLPGNHADLRGALAHARGLAENHGWTIHVNDRHGTHWRTLTPPGQPAEAALRAGQADPAEAITNASPWEVHTEPAPYKQRTLAGGFTGLCGPHPGETHGRWGWVIGDPITGSGHVAGGAADGEEAAERAIADWEIAHAGGYDPLSDLAILLARSIQQLRNADVGPDAAAARSRLCRQLGITKDQTDAEVETRIRGRIPALRAGQAEDACVVILPEFGVHEVT